MLLPPGRARSACCPTTHDCLPLEHIAVHAGRCGDPPHRPLRLLPAPAGRGAVAAPARAARADERGDRQLQADRGERLGQRHPSMTLPPPARSLHAAHLRAHQRLIIFRSRSPRRSAASTQSSTMPSSSCARDRVDELARAHAPPACRCAAWRCSRSSCAPRSRPGRPSRARRPRPSRAAWRAVSTLAGEDQLLRGAQADAAREQAVGAHAGEQVEQDLRACPICALSSATITSEESAHSKPPPSASPCTSEIVVRVGLKKLWMRG